MDDECVAGTRRTAALLESLGHDVEETMPPYPIDEVGHAMRVVMTTPIAAEIDARLEELGRELREDDLEPFTHVLYGFGKATSGTEYVAALQAVERAGLRLGPFFEEHDVLLTPTLPIPPPPLGLLDTTDPQAMYAARGRDPGAHQLLQRHRSAGDLAAPRALRRRSADGDAARRGAGTGGPAPAARRPARAGAALVDRAGVATARGVSARHCRTRAAPMG